MRWYLMAALLALSLWGQPAEASPQFANEFPCARNKPDGLDWLNLGGATDNYRYLFRVGYVLGVMSAWRTSVTFNGTIADAVKLITEGCQRQPSARVIDIARQVLLGVQPK